MEATYKQIERQMLESIPENFDDREVLEVLEHIQSMIDMWQTTSGKELVTRTYLSIKHK